MIPEIYEKILGEMILEEHCAKSNLTNEETAKEMKK